MRQVTLHGCRPVTIDLPISQGNSETVSVCVPLDLSLLGSDLKGLVANEFSVDYFGIALQKTKDVSEVATGEWNLEDNIAYRSGIFPVYVYLDDSNTIGEEQREWHDLVFNAGGVYKYTTNVSNVQFQLNKFWTKTFKGDDCITADAYKVGQRLQMKDYADGSMRWSAGNLYITLKKSDYVFEENNVHALYRKDRRAAAATKLPRGDLHAKVTFFVMCTAMITYQQSEKEIRQALQLKLQK